MLYIFFFSTLNLYLSLEAQILRLALKHYPQIPSSRDTCVTMLCLHLFDMIPFKWFASKI